MTTPSYPLLVRVYKALLSPARAHAADDDWKVSGDQDFTPQAFHIEAQGRAAHPG